MVEVYDLEQGLNVQLANVSTRGFVGTGENVLIGGVIVGPTDAPSADLIIRAIGPSLGDDGVSGFLNDPILELHDKNGVLLATNDNWKDDPAQAPAITAAGLAPKISARKRDSTDGQAESLCRDRKGQMRDDRSRASSKFTTSRSGLAARLAARSGQLTLTVSPNFWPRSSECSSMYLAWPKRRS